MLVLLGFLPAMTFLPLPKTEAYRFPMAGNTFLLAGTFGEIRNNHFHSGIDIKTGGGIGQPLLAVRDGYIYRIKVSPFGFGKAIYLRHADGEFSVYGHMNGFTAPIEAFVYQKQYASKQYEQEIYLDEGQMPVKAGDLIGFSGNSGSSSGPHLHFEIRDPEERIMNPLNYYQPYIADHKKPEVSGIAFEPITVHSRVNGRHEKLLLKPEGGNGDYRVAGVVQLQGKVGLEYDAFDQLDGAANSCGINYAKLYLDEQLIYEFALEKFTFDDKKYINVHFDYAHHKAGGRKLQRSYVEPGNELVCHPQSVNRGWIDLQDDQVHALRLELADGYRNTSIVRVNVQRGRATALPTSVSGGQGQRLQSSIRRNVCVLRLSKPVSRQLQGLTVTFADGSTELLPPAYLDGDDLVYLLDLNQCRQPASVGDPIAGHRVDFQLRQKVYPARDNVVEEGELQVFLPAGCVFDSLPLHLRRLPGGSNRWTDSYEVGRMDQPIFKSFVLQFKPAKTGDPSRMVVARKQGGSWVFVGNERKPDGSISAASGDFGTFCVMADSTPPTLKPVNFKSGSTISPSQRTLSLQIGDSFSGIA
ncbi:MAG TPA: M23 family metallopeptidase, partial [Bacteroidia bacterium]|nr:M23 family metallopeptidase [Bacteroidia bacterium]